MSGDVNLWLLGYFPRFALMIPLLAFLAPIIGGGELGVVAVAFLFAGDTTRFLIISLFSALGMIATDSVWFFIARSKLFMKFKEWRKISAQYKQVEKSIERLSQGRDLLMISLAKILVGTRILLILYIGGRNISFKKYLIYNATVNLLWAIILVFIGVVASKGFNSIVAIFRSTQLAITFLVIFFAGLYMIQKWMSQRLMKKPEV